jgi:protein involved in polysaccharide export with SLBB domain
VISLENGDNLLIPRKKNSVTIVGEVQWPISQVYENQLSYLDYIFRSGGLTNKADEDRIYIIKANGGVHIPESSNWFASNSQTLEPGDTIVVPLDAEKIDEVILWRDMSQIFYQIALGVVAVGSL